MHIQFIVKINKDKSEIYSGNIINGFKQGYGKIEYWTSRVEIGEFINNKKNGYFTEYFAGEKVFEGYYFNDKKDGLGKSFLRQKLYDEGCYNNGEKNGEFKEYDIDTGLLKAELYYKDGKKYNGIDRGPDYDGVFVDYQELTDEEKSNLIEEILNDYAYWLDERDFEELYNLLGIKKLERKHVEDIIEKFINSNFDEDSIYGKVVQCVFENKKIWVDRFVIDLEVSEYSKGIRFIDSRFDEFKDYFDEEFYKDIMCHVKNIYFRKLEVIEFVEHFIELYGKDIFSSLNLFVINWLSVVTYISETCQCNMYEEFLEYYCFNINYESSMNYCKKIFGKSQQFINKKLLMYFKIIDNKYKFKSKKESVLVAWLLLYYKMIQYFSKEFLNKFKKSYEEFLELNLEECVKIYVKINKNNEDEFEKLLFISFLLDNRKILKQKSIIDIAIEKRGLISQRFEFDIIGVYEKISELIESAKYNRDVEVFENYIMNYKKEKKKISIEDIDYMEGYKFEEFICELFRMQGYAANLTTKSNDQGIDIIIEWDKKRIGVQAKRYSGKVGNSAIQEVVAGLSFYGLDKGMVITNSIFTKSARELADANKILLWDRSRLIEKIKEINFMY